MTQTANHQAGDGAWRAVGRCASLGGVVAAAASGAAAMVIVGPAIPHEPPVLVLPLFYAGLGYLVGYLGGIAVAGLGGSLPAWILGGFLSGGVVGVWVAGFPSTRHTLETLWESSGAGVVLAAVGGAVVMGVLGDAARRGRVRRVRPADLETLRAAKRRLLLAIPAIGILCLAGSVAFMRPKDLHAAAGSAVQTLRLLRQAEGAYRKQHGTYAPVGAIRVALAAEQRVVLDEKGVDQRSGYRFSGSAGRDTYTLVATPPRPDGDYFTLTETGDITP